MNVEFFLIFWRERESISSVIHSSKLVVNIFEGKKFGMRDQSRPKYYKDIKHYMQISKYGVVMIFQLKLYLKKKKVVESKNQVAVRHLGC